MKKKLALLLAAVMLITAALPMNLLATTYTGLGTTSYVDKGGWITTYGGGTLMLDSNLNAGNLGLGTLYLRSTPTGSNITYSNGTIAARASSSTSYPVANNGSGLNLVMTFQRDFTVPSNGASFWLNYDNAYHAFMSYGVNSLLRDASGNVAGTATKTYSNILTSGSDGVTGLKFSLNTGDRGTSTVTSGGDMLVNTTDTPVVALQNAVNAGLANVLTTLGTPADLTKTPAALYAAYQAGAATIISAWTGSSAANLQDEKNALTTVAEEIYQDLFDTVIQAGTYSDYDYSATPAPIVADYNDGDNLETIFDYPAAAIATFQGLATAYANSAGLYKETPAAASTTVPQTVTAALEAFNNALYDNNDNETDILGALIPDWASLSSNIATIDFGNVQHDTTAYVDTAMPYTVPKVYSINSDGTDFKPTNGETITTAATFNGVVEGNFKSLNAAMYYSYQFINAGYPTTWLANVRSFFTFTAPTAAELLAALKAERVTYYDSTLFNNYTTDTGDASDPYYVYGDAYVAGLGRSGNKAIGYTIEVQPSVPNQALVTVPAGTVIKAGDILIVPMVMMTVAGGTEVKYQVISNNAELFNSVGLTTISTTSTTSGTTLTVSSVAKQAKGRIYLGDIVIQERSSNRINNGTFYLVPPAGYKFVALSNYAATYSIPFNTESGKSITYQSSGTSGTFYSYPTIGNIDGTTINTLNDYWATRSVYETNAAGGLAVTLGGLTMNRTAFGNITITGLALEPLSSDAYLFDTLGDSLSVYIYGGATTTGVSTTSVVAATREDWNVSYTAGTPVVAFSGKTDVPVAEITVEELTLDSWNAKWDTEFTVVDAEGNALDGVKISAVGVTATNMSKVSGSFTSYNASYNSSIDAYGDEFQNIGLSDLYSTTPKVYTNTSFRRDGHTFIVSDLYPSTTNVLQKMRLTFELSVEPNFEGEVYIQMAGTAVSNNSIDEITNMGIVKVAEFYPPVSISTSTTEVQIGYQKYDVADVVITENFDLVGEAALEAGKKVQLALGEYGAGRLTDYMYFAPISKTDVTVTGDPNFAMSEVTMVNLAATGAYVNYYTGLTQRALEFTITRKSKTAGAEITITNLGVNIDRDVPNGQYDLLVGGSAITDNWIDPTQNYLYLYDRFDVWGVIEPGYINMITDPVNVVTQNTVTLKSGTNIIQVNGKDEEIPVPVLNVDGRMYVPIRFAAVALNVPDSNIIFDEGSRKVVITTAERIVTFQQDSPIYTINGVELSMNEGGVEAVTFIDPQTDRAYIPVRFLAYALNVSVDYDPETGEAILNAK